MAKHKITFDLGPFGSKHNSMFCPGPNMHLNACVGKNGGPAGFDRYASGYFEAGAICRVVERASSALFSIAPWVTREEVGDAAKQT